MTTSTIVDQWGRPIDLSAIREPQSESDARPQVAALHREFEGHPGRTLTPARLHSILTAAEQGDLLAQLDLADDIEERDGHTYSELAKRKLAVQMLDWDIEPPPNASSEEQAVADRVREWVSSIPSFEEDVLLEMMDAVLKGFKGIEMWWEADQGTLQPRLAARPQRWLCLGEDRNSLRLRDGCSTYGQPLTPYGWMLHIHRSRNGYLARGSLVRILAPTYLFKHFAIRDLAEFLEIYGLPVRLGKYPAGASDAEKRKLLQAVVGIGHNAGGIIPQSMALDLLNAADGNEGPFRTMWHGMDAVQSKIILGQTLSSSEGQHGTQALGNVHNEVRHDIQASDAKRVAATLTAQLVAPMVLLNIPGANPRRLPRFVLDVSEAEELSRYADALPKLAAAGMRIGVSDMHRRLHIEEADEGDELLQGLVPGTVAPVAPVAPVPPGALSPAPAVPAQSQVPPVAAPVAALSAHVARAPAPRDALDDLVESALADWQPVMTGLVAPLMAEIEKAIAAGETLTSFRDRLPALNKAMDSAALTERVARANFAARLAGEADLDLSGQEQP